MPMQPHSRRWNTPCAKVGVDLNLWKLFLVCKSISVQCFFSLPPSFPTGDALLTVATGPLSDKEAERAGLVPTHAYAVLNVVEIKVRGNRNLHNNDTLRPRVTFIPLSNWLCIFIIRLAHINVWESMEKPVSHCSAY